MRRTKIVCTLGPSVASRAGIEGLIRAGMNVARLNCSHGDWEEKRQWIAWIRELSPTVGPVAILADLQGPKFRIGQVAERALVAGESLVVGPDPDADVPILQREILEAMKPGARLLLGDGDIELQLGLPQGSGFQATAISGGALRSRQGVTIKNIHFNTAPLTPKDLEDLRLAAEAGVDFIALSYLRSAEDHTVLRHEVDKHDRRIHLVAKIETREALHDIERVAKAFDAIMVARGDMGLQMDIEEVPLAQKRIIEVCNRLGKPVITATQMLESMMKSPRPTRAEATDVANAILDGTDAVMLSGETAAGQYPTQCVETMARIAERAESLLDHRGIREDFRESASRRVDHTEAIAHSVCDLASQIRVKAIVTTSTSGQTARRVSKFRPEVPLYCASWDPRTVAQLALVWGVQAVHVPMPATIEANIDHAMRTFRAAKVLKTGDPVIVTSGVPIGHPGNTNLIQVVSAP